jgi:bacteriophage N4 adsorption protein B
VDGMFYWVEFWQHELLLFSAIWFLIGALDDCMIDVIWGVRYVYRYLRYYRHIPPIQIDQLPAPLEPGLLAIFIATWNESAVIGEMLRNCQNSWRGNSSNYRIYVGCYPNDSAGIAAIMLASRSGFNIRLVLCSQPGPTTKADCLNRLWQALVNDELSEGRKAKAIILHDAEDMVHPDELKLYDRLIERNQVVQLPVVPVRVPGSPWVSGHYLDEFAEAHGKSLVVREAVGAALPLAGVGCAIDRSILGLIALANHHQPFDSSSLTEDYELGLRIGAMGGKTILARVLDARGKIIGTRACFPNTISTAVRQKARWLTGIALAGWDRIGWQGGLAEYWMLLRDRRAIFGAVVLCTAYLCIILTGILIFGKLTNAYIFLPQPPVTEQLLWINFGFLLWRLLVRGAFVAALYGPLEAILSIPRTFVANIISILAARRACFAYVRHCLGSQLIWDKTAHQHFPKMHAHQGGAN